MDIYVLYQDEDILLCIKPAGIVSEAGGMPQLLRAQTGVDTVFCVHRLDRDTAGLMVYAKTKRAAAALSSMIASGQLHKKYLAVVQGLPQSAGVMEDLLFHDAARNKSYVVKRDRKGVRKARLSYRTLAQCDGLSLLLVSLETGRSHQIRVQFSSRGMPLVGDRKYGSTWRDVPLALWSAALSFPHPLSGETVSVEAPPPDHWPWSLFPSE